MNPNEKVRELAEKIVEESGGDFVPSVVASKVVVECPPDVLSAWLHDNARYFLTREIGNWLRSQRATARAAGPRTAFSEAADAGDVSRFAVVYVVDEDNTRRKVADMTAADHRFVAAGYHRSAQTDLMLAAFHDAVAKKIGKKTTAEALTEEQYDRLMRSISGKTAQAA